MEAKKKFYSREEAINIFNSGVEKSEVYGGPLAFKKEKTFAFIVIYGASSQKDNLKKWRVALHNKSAIISKNERKYFEGS